MNRNAILFAFILTGLFAALTAFPVFPQAGDIIAKAQEAYDKESFEKAYEIVDKNIPETADSAQKAQASSFLTSIGISEYNAKNWKNAFDAFRKALKYQPTNSLATQYFLKIRTEKGIANLKNEGAPRIHESAAAKPAQTAEQPAAQTSAVPAQVQGALVRVAPAPAQPGLLQPTIELEEVKKALELTSSQLKTMEQTVSTTSRENEALKTQIDQQLKMIKTFMEQQAKTPQSPERTEAEKVLIAKTMEVLTKLSVQEPKTPQVVLQHDPDIKNLVHQLVEQQKGNSRTSWLTYSNIIALVVLSIGVLIIAVFFIILTRRARSRTAQRSNQGMEGSSSSFGPSYNYQISEPRSGSLPLLGFMGSEGTVSFHPADLEFLKELIHTDRMIQMIEEMRNGKLSWNMIRENIGELEVSLKIDILKVVEKKLAEGDLLTSEAVLPVLFPFLNDFDEYIREKSNLLARKALIGDKKLLPSGSDQDSSPLSLKSLMNIPTQLAEVLRGLDQSLVTAKLSRSVAAVLGLSNEECNLIYKTSIAHDCGYLILDRDRIQRIITKPEISEEDFDFIKQHTVKGPEYFQGIDLPTQFRDGIVYHHERNDGSGYPEGLTKEQIPLFAKIIGVSETLATLIAKRPYRSKRDLSHALAILEDASRTKFDQEIVQALSQTASAVGR